MTRWNNIWVLIAFLAIAVLIGVTGCSSKTEEYLKPCSSKVEVVEKYIPVACEVPKVDCNFTGDNFEPTQKLLDCLILHKKLLKACTETK